MMVQGARKPALGLRVKLRPVPQHGTVRFIAKVGKEPGPVIDHEY